MSRVNFPIKNVSSKLFLRDQELFIIIMCKKMSFIASSMQKDGWKFQLARIVDFL